MKTNLANAFEQILTHVDDETRLELATVLLRQIGMTPEDYLKPLPITGEKKG